MMLIERHKFKTIFLIKYLQLGEKCIYFATFAQLNDSLKGHFALRIHRNYIQYAGLHSFITIILFIGFIFFNRAKNAKITNFSPD